MSWDVPRRESVGNTKEVLREGLVRQSPLHGRESHVGRDDGRCHDTEDLSTVHQCTGRWGSLRLVVSTCVRYSGDPVRDII